MNGHFRSSGWIWWAFGIGALLFFLIPEAPNVPEDRQIEARQEAKLPLVGQKKVLSGAMACPYESNLTAILDDSGHVDLNDHFMSGRCTFLFEDATVTILDGKEVFKGANRYGPASTIRIYQFYVDTGPKRGKVYWTIGATFGDRSGMPY